MNKRMYDALGVLMDGIIVLSCDARPVAKIICDNTLGGSWFIQEVGEPSIKASVNLSVKGMSAKDNVLSKWKKASTIKIDYDGYVRTGAIITEPVVSMIRPGQPENRKYSVSFTLAVFEEASS